MELASGEDKIHHPMRAIGISQDDLDNSSIRFWHAKTFQSKVIDSGGSKNIILDNKYYKPVYFFSKVLKIG